MARTWDRPAYVPAGSGRVGVVGLLALAAGPVRARGARAGCRCRRAGSEPPRGPGGGRPGRGRWEMGGGRRSSSSPWPSMISAGQWPAAVTARAGRQRASPGRGRPGRDRGGPGQERGAPAGRQGAGRDRPHRRYRRGPGSGPAVTGIWAGCVAIARPCAPRIGGRARHDARVCSTADLPFRTIAVLPGPSRHDRKSTANAVGPCGPAGFKSPILRSDQQFRPGAPSRGTAGFRFPGPLRGHRRNPAAHLPHSLPAPPRGPCHAGIRAGSPPSPIVMAHARLDGVRDRIFIRTTRCHERSHLGFGWSGETLSLPGGVVLRWRAFAGALVRTGL
jgi:hypothetical protein